MKNNTDENNPKPRDLILWMNGCDPIMVGKCTKIGFICNNMDLLDIIRVIISDKESGHRRPLIATFGEIYARQADSWAAMYDKLLELEAAGLIHIGNTLNGKYVKINE